MDDEAEWDPRFRDAYDGSVAMPMVRLTPETAVIRDQSFHPSGWGP